MNDPKIIAAIIAGFAIVCCAVIVILIFRRSLREEHEWDQWLFGALFALAINGFVAIVASNLALDGAHQNIASNAVASVSDSKVIAPFIAPIIAAVIALFATICCTVIAGVTFRPPLKKLYEWDKWVFGALFALLINGLVAVVAGNIALDGVYDYFSNKTAAFAESESAI